MRILISVSVIAASFALTLPASAQSSRGSAASAPATPFIFHGNYCGKGNRGESLPPVDALDAVCRRHDLCSPATGVPSRTCNDQLRSEASRVATSPRQPEDLRMLAQLVAQGAELLACEGRQADSRTSGTTTRQRLR